MKTISEFLSACFLISLCWVVPSMALAQDEKLEVGFIRIVNAVAPGTGNTRILIDGEDIFPKGYKLGQRTGGFGLKAGSHSVTIEKDGVKSGTTKVTLANGETITLIGFAEKVAAEEEDEPPVWETKILRLKQSDPESGFRLAVVSLCPQDEIRLTAEILGKPKPEQLFAKRMTITSVSLGNSKSDIQIKVGDELITSLGTEDRGNYVVVLYEDEDGKIKGLSFYDPKFVIAG